MIFWVTWGGHSEAESCSKDVVGHPVLMGDAERPSQYSGSTLFFVPGRSDPQGFQ